MLFLVWFIFLCVFLSILSLSFQEEYYKYMETLRLANWLSDINEVRLRDCGGGVLGGGYWA